MFTLQSHKPASVLFFSICWRKPWPSGVLYLQQLSSQSEIFVPEECEVHMSFDSVFWCLQHKYSLLWDREDKKGFSPFQLEWQFPFIILPEFQNEVICEDKLYIFKKKKRERTSRHGRAESSFENDVHCRTLILYWFFGNWRVRDEILSIQRALSKATA